MGKNTRQIFALCMTIFVVTLVGCGKSRFDRKDAQPQYNAPPVRVWQDNGNPNQPVVGVNPGCNQPTREFTDINEFCVYITDENIHKGCNTEAQRQMIYQEKCVIGSVPTVNSPPIKIEENRPAPRPTVTSGTTTVTTRTVVQGGQTLTVEQRAATIRAIGLCNPVTVVNTKTQVVPRPGAPAPAPAPVAQSPECISKEKIKKVLSSSKNRSVLKCDTTDAKQIGSDELGNPLWEIQVLSGNEISDKEVIAGCKCIVELNCKAKRKTNGKTDLSMSSVEGCNKDEQAAAIYQCANRNCPATVQEVAPPKTCVTETVTNGPISETTAPTCGNPVPAPAPVPGEPLPVPAPAPAPIEVVEENSCYPMKSQHLELLTSLPSEERYVQLSDKFNLESKLAEMSRKHSGSRMVVARVNAHVDAGSRDGVVSLEFKQAVVDQIYGSIPSCQDYSLNERPCPIKSVNQSNSNVVMELNNSKAKIYSLDTRPGLSAMLISYINVAGRTNIEYISSNEIKITTKFIAHFDKASGRFVDREGAGIETNQITLADRIIWTKNPRAVRIKAEPSLVGLLKATRSEALAPNCGSQATKTN